MPVEIKSTKDVAVHGVKMVVYGRAGSGKTRLAATAPNPIIISAEHGLLSLVDNELPYIEVNTLQDVGDAFEYLKDNNEYDTIIIDSLSEIAEVLLNQFKKTAKDKRQAYGQIADSLSSMIRNFRDLPGKNVVFTAKLRTREDEDAGTIEYMPSLPGRVLPESLPYFTDLVLCIQVKRRAKKEISMIQTFSDHQYVCKDRSGKLDPFEEPNLTAIFNKIVGKG